MCHHEAAQAHAATSYVSHETSSTVEAHVATVLRPFSEGSGPAAADARHVESREARTDIEERAWWRVDTTE